ncbi:unnamed protein product [Rodentolepis nana]|uniref:Homeobox domain-containing protein n=1 Tax=Rodentolepis nana TaxID=102285 RepID=A0A0R3TFF3_RODNA|nr:unnamed protein product [Rodentolepis nana]
MQSGSHIIYATGYGGISSLSSTNQDNGGMRPTNTAAGAPLTLSALLSGHSSTDQMSHANQIPTSTGIYRDEAIFTPHSEIGIPFSNPTPSSEESIATSSPSAANERRRKCSPHNRTQTVILEAKFQEIKYIERNLVEEFNKQTGLNPSKVSLEI